MMVEMIKNMMTPCVMLDRKSTDGPYGPEYTYTDGAAFQAAVIKDRTLAARVAAHEGVTELYTVTAPASVQLDFHDCFRRLSDGATFRVTSNAKDSQPPEMASFRFTQVTAERWDIPK